jgi:hypothetical protein
MRKSENIYHFKALPLGKILPLSNLIQIGGFQALISPLLEPRSATTCDSQKTTYLSFTAVINSLFPMLYRFLEISKRAERLAFAMHIGLCPMRCNCLGLVTHSTSSNASFVQLVSLSLF